jgi:hypothetical protein
MNDRRDQHKGAIIDPQVAAHYGLIADEAAPPELDRIVLQNASSAARSDRRQYPFKAWLRPAAFVATAVLSLALILDLNEVGILTPLAGSTPEARGPSAVAPVTGPATDAAASSRTAAETANALRREKALTTVSSKIAAPEAAAQRDGVGPATDGGEPGQCNDRQKSHASAWWQCVVSLRHAGLSDLAESELLSLQKEYPDFVTPE